MSRVEEKKVLEMFKKSDALLKGHFRLSSGLHSGQYLQCALVLQYPEIAQRLSKAIAYKFSTQNIDVVIGPALGGVTLAYEVARALGVRSLFTERHDGKMVLRRGFSVSKGEKTLVVEDVVTTGGSSMKAVRRAEEEGLKVLGVVTLVDREEGGREQIEKEGFWLKSIFTKLCKSTFT